MKKRIILSLLCCSSFVMSQELVYTPINPSFGGNPLNGTFLLNKANAQNQHTAPVTEESFAETLQSRLESSYISRIVSEITSLAFGEETYYDADGNPIDSIFDENSIFVSGNFQVELITENPDTLVIEITNLLNGEVTTVEIPRF